MAMNYTKTCTKLFFLYFLLFAGWLTILAHGFLALLLLFLHHKKIAIKCLVQVMVNPRNLIPVIRLWLGPVGCFFSFYYYYFFFLYNFFFAMKIVHFSTCVVFFSVQSTIFFLQFFPESLSLCVNYKYLHFATMIYRGKN